MNTILSTNLNFMENPLLQLGEYQIGNEFMPYTIANFRPFGVE